MKPIIKEENLIKKKFKLIEDWKEPEEEVEIGILFVHAIIPTETIEKINNFAKEIKKIKRLIVPCFYSAPNIIGEIIESEKLKVYILICNSKVEEIKISILNDSKKLPGPIEDDYRKVVVEQLMDISQP